MTLFLPISPVQEYPLAALAGNACHCGFPTTRFPLHEREDEQLCAQKCSAEEFESCGTPSYFIVYQTQVQGKPGFSPWTPLPAEGSPPAHPSLSRSDYVGQSAGARAGLENLAWLSDPNGQQRQGL